jgi:hypothetical protein
MPSRVELVLLVLLILLAEAAARDIYISVNGSNDSSCGNISSPCSIFSESLRNGQTGHGPNSKFLFFDGEYSIDDASANSFLS